MRPRRRKLCQRVLFSCWVSHSLRCLEYWLRNLDIVAPLKNTVQPLIANFDMDLFVTQTSVHPALPPQTLQDHISALFRMAELEFMTVLLLEVDDSISDLLDKKLTIFPLDIAFTFDDGPYLYTNDLLDKLAAYDAKATFMISMLISTS